MKVTGYVSFITLQEKKMAFYIATIGCTQFQTIVHRPLGIENFQFLYTQSGKGQVFLNGTTYELKKGSILFIPPNTAHEYHRIDTEWKTLYITFNGSSLPGFFDLEPAVWTFPFDFEKWWNLLYFYKQKPDYFKELSVSLYSMLLEIKDHAAQTSLLTPQKQHMLTYAMHYLAEEPEPQLHKITEELGISEAHFCRIFKEYTGYRPFEYMNLIKIQKARELLKNSKLGISEIAKSVGYESHSYFSLLFKRYTGMTPTEYRG